MHDSNKNKKVPVSVIIPCYNCSESINLTVESVIKQTSLPEELFLINDASSDNGKTIAALRLLKDRLDNIINIHVINLGENKGPAFARNAGWEAASQPYIAFLDADDLWHPNKLEIIYSIIHNNGYIDLIGHDFYIGSDNKGGYPSVALMKKHKLVRKDYYSILLMSPFVTPSIFLKRCIPERFNVKMRYCEDYEFLLRIAHSYKVYYTKHKLVQLGKEPFSGGGLTADRTRMRLGEISMYFEILKYNRSLIFLLPFLIFLSVTKHVVFLAINQCRKKTIT